MIFGKDMHFPAAIIKFKIQCLEFKVTKCYVLFHYQTGSKITKAAFI